MNTTLLHDRHPGGPSTDPRAARRWPACAVVAVLLASASPAALAADGLTAHSKLDQATAVAKKWKADAVLESVATTDVKADGTAVVWQYHFHSDSTRSCFRVWFAATGATNSTDLGKCTPATPIATDFVDSAAAFKGAVAGGFKPGDTNGMHLIVQIDRALPKPRECWVLFSPKNDFDKSNAAMRGWCVDPKSGALVTRLAGQR